MHSAHQGRVALVTGGSSGIGRSLGLRLAEGGSELCVAYSHSEEAATKVVAEARSLGVRALAVNADLHAPDAVDVLVDRCESGLGKVDILVSNAGVSVHKPWEMLTLEDWEHTQTVNVRAPFLLAQRTLPGMRDRGFGRALFVSSVAAFTGGLIGPHYAASKAALAGLVHFYAPRVAPQDVTVNALAPALIAETGMLPLDPEDPAMAGLVPVGRLGRPEEVADLALAMLRNGYLTNKIVTLDGGIHPR